MMERRRPRLGNCNEKGASRGALHHDRDDDEDSELHQPKERGEDKLVGGARWTESGMDSLDHICHLIVSMQYSIYGQIEGIYLCSGGTKCHEQSGITRIIPLAFATNPQGILRPPHDAFCARSVPNQNTHRSHIYLAICIDPLHSSRLYNPASWSPLLLLLLRPPHHP
jgi:hypothetical protein